MARSTPRGLVVLVSFGLVLDVCWGADTHAQSESALLRVRIRDRNVERAVADGTRRSLTFRSLIERVEHSRGLLYIFKAPYLADKMEGCVVLDGGGAWEDRYLRMAICLRSDHADPARLLRAGLSPNHDFDVLVKRRQQVHQAFDGEARQLVVTQRRGRRLRYP